MIEEFYKKNSCETVYNYHSRYKGLCKEKIVIVNNQFSIDFLENIDIKYDEISNIKLQDKDILIKSINRSEKLYFQEKVDSQKFFEELKKRLD